MLRALRHYRRAQDSEARRHPKMAAALARVGADYVFVTKRGDRAIGGQLTRMLKRDAVGAGVAVIPATGKPDPKTGYAWDCPGGLTSRLSPYALRRAWATHAMKSTSSAASSATSP